LSALDAVTGDLTEYSRASEAARNIIRSMIPGWEPAPMYADPGSNADEPWNPPSNLMPTSMDEDLDFTHEFADPEALPA
jgi:hypothetical protein